MKRSNFSAVILGTFLVAVVAMVGAQEPRKDGDQEPRKRQDEPQRKGMMRGMMGQGMPMQGMMPMMMMEMHQRHAATESQWEATDDGVYVLRPDTLLKYDKDLKLAKTVDLPELPMMPRPGRDGDEAKDRPRIPGPMRQMMARMHGALPAKLAVTPDAVFVSRGNSLLKFNRDLDLQKSTDLPDTKPMPCPMCEQMMGAMEGRMRGGREE